LVLASQETVTGLGWDWKLALQIPDTAAVWAAARAVEPDWG